MVVISDSDSDSVVISKATSYFPGLNLSHFTRLRLFGKG